MAAPPLALTRQQILAYRRRVGSLDERLAPGAASLREAAWAGLQDSMPRAALLSIHARVRGAQASSWEDPSLVQLWGPRFSTYVVAAQDRAIFTLGRLPDDPAGRRRAEAMADRVRAVLGERRVPDGEVGRALGINPAYLRYAAPTGTILIRWDGARQPIIWAVPPPGDDPLEARLELARRYLHVLGPGTAAGFATWAGLKPPPALAAFEALTKAGTVSPVRTPIGDAWVLEEDAAAFRNAPGPTAAARLLPSGDAYYLLQGADRQLLVPEAEHREQLWTSRVWPGAVVVAGDIVGTWRRADATLTIQAWRGLSSVESAAVEAEAAGLPLPGLRGPIVVRWVAA